jgi:hypothetical protein
MTQVTRRFISRDSVKRNMLVYSMLWHPESAFIHFMSFGDLDNNTFKGLTIC